jgi:hypothetical protein
VIWALPRVGIAAVIQTVPGSAQTAQKLVFLTSPGRWFTGEWVLRGRLRRNLSHVTAGRDEVRVRVFASGLEYTNVLIRRHLYPQRLTQETRADTAEKLSTGAFV